MRITVFHVHDQAEPDMNHTFFSARRILPFANNMTSLHTLLILLSSSFPHHQEHLTLSSADSMATAANKALETVELLEAIFLWLPQKDILVFQRVCKFWKSVIDSSTMLQTLLSFLATQAPTGTTHPGTPSLRSKQKPRQKPRLTLPQTCTTQTSSWSRS